MGLPQSQFDAWDEYDKAYAVLTHRTLEQMRSWEDQLQADEIERQKRKDKHGI